MGMQFPKGSSRDSSAMKKAYVAPVMVRWGTLRDMTKHVGSSGHNDGGSVKKKTKTR